MDGGNMGDRVRRVMRGAVEHLDAILVVTGCCLLFFALRHEIASVDEVDRFRSLERFMSGGGFTSTPYSMVGPVFAAPLWLLGRVAMDPAWWCARYNTVLFFIALVVLFRSLRAFGVDGRLTWRFLLVLVGASMLANGQRGFFGDIFTAVALGCGIAAAFAGRAAAGWTTAALGAANMPASIPALGFVAAYEWLRARRWRQFLLVMLAVGIVLLDNWVRRGHPLRSGYENNHGVQTVLPYSGLPGFSYPFLFGVMSILFSFGKGVFFFAPGLLYCGRFLREHGSNAAGATVKAWLVVLAVLVVVYAKWWAWYGGFSWGPRFFLIAALPASLALAAATLAPHRTLPRLALMGAVTLSVWAWINGAVYHLDNLGIAVENNYALESLTWYTPEFSPLWRPLTVRRTLHSADTQIVVFGLLVWLRLVWPHLVGTAGDARRFLRGLRAGPCN